MWHGDTTVSVACTVYKAVGRQVLGSEIQKFLWFKWPTISIFWTLVWVPASEENFCSMELDNSGDYEVDWLLGLGMMNWKGRFRSLRSQVLTASSMKTAVLWVVASGRSLPAFQRRLPPPSSGRWPVLIYTPEKTTSILGNFRLADAKRETRWLWNTSEAFTCSGTLRYVGKFIHDRRKTFEWNRGVFWDNISLNSRPLWDC
jgi:hypothetical protein